MWQVQVGARLVPSVGQGREVGPSVSPARTRAPSPGRGVLPGLCGTTLVPKIKSQKLERQQTPLPTTGYQMPSGQPYAEKGPSALDTPPWG